MKSIIIILLLNSVHLFASKPFSIWQFDKETQIEFGIDECQYEIKTDETKKEIGYQNTDILTDEKGSLLFSIDKYNDKIVIRDSNDIVLFEHNFDNQNARTNIESVILPSILTVFIILFISLLWTMN